KGLNSFGSIEMPLDKFSVGAAAVGTDDLIVDSDLIARRHGEKSEDKLVPTLSWAAADLLGAPITKRKNDWWKTRWVNYYGPPATLPNVSYYQALSTNELRPGFF